MENSKLVGPKAGPLKYDILTAISAVGLHGTPTEQTSMIRLSIIITARYNWRLDEITIGQVELARLWGVNERTVKREMKRILNAGILTCLRPGVRGRVGAYRLNYRRLYEISRNVWPLIGSDFEERMVEISGEKNVLQVNFQPKLVNEIERPAGSGTWGAVRRHLKAGDPASFESWFAKLVQEELTADSLTLRAPNSFVARYIEVHFAKRLADAVEQEMPTDNGTLRRIILMTEN